MKTGFTGLGAMGRHMARRLMDAGHLYAVCNRTTAVAAEFAAETGCRHAGTVAELATVCDAIVLCVSADEDVLALVRDIAVSMRPGGLVIDCSTTSAATARDAARVLADRQIGFLDCPVSGGTEGARLGTLVIMAGGEARQLRAARPVLDAMAARVTHMGPAGSGQAAKAVNQVMIAGINQAVSEALAFASVQGLPMDSLIDTMAAGAAGNWFLAHRGKTMVRNEFPLGFKVSLHRKDLEICRAMAAEHDAHMPLVEMTLLHYRRMIAEGFGDNDISSLFTMKQKLFSRGEREKTPGDDG